ncbi:MAG: short chain dehydrogenase, partial [Nitrospirae bacterium]|nr:short chain dehydrogenase [Nitrospirota bacterium]
MTSLFSDRIAIITGAASGIGLALSRELCARGAVVVMADRDAAGLAAA